MRTHKSSLASNFSEHVFCSKASGGTVCVTTNGCSENRMDCARMLEFFRRNGWVVTTDLKEADTIFFNACGLTTFRENNSLKVLRIINTHKKHSAKVIIWGCFPRINKIRICAAHNGVVFADDESERLEEFFEGNIKAQDVSPNFLVKPWQTNGRRTHAAANYTDVATYIEGLIVKRICGPSYEAVSFVDDDSYFIKASTGCLNACSYCGVRFARGKLRSEPIQKIQQQFKEGLEKGFTKFTLVGTDLGAYGRDRGDSLVDLLNSLVKGNGKYKLRLPNINPRWLSKMLFELRDIMRTGKVEVIGCGVQSGSNRILRIMKRNHTIEEYKEAIFVLKEACPSLRVRTNIVVGFPGETESDFRQTIQLLKETNFTYADIHRYAPRSGTRAATMGNQIPWAVVEARYWRLLLLFTLIIRKRNGFQIAVSSIN